MVTSNEPNMQESLAEHEMAFPLPSPLAEHFSIPEISVLDWQEALHLQNTDRYAYGQSEEIHRFYTQFWVELNKRCQMFRDGHELADEIRAYVEVAFERMDFDKLDQMFGLEIESVYGNGKKFHCVEPDFSMFYAMDCIAKWILNYGTSGDPELENFALEVGVRFIDRPRRFWPIFVSRLYVLCPSAVPYMVNMFFDDGDDLLELKTVEFFAKLLVRQHRSNHPNDIMMAGCWIRNALAELESLKSGNMEMFLQAINTFVVTCQPLIFRYPNDWATVLKDIRTSLRPSGEHWEITKFLPAFAHIEKKIQDLVKDNVRGV